jgi:ComF family protein
VVKHGLLCSSCFRTVSFITQPCCTRCGVPFGAAGLAGLCPSCIEAPPVFHRARAALRYDEAARRLILPFKHADRVELSGVLAAYMVRAGAELLAAADILVPVPLHRARLFRRRYNQAALLARSLGRAARRRVMLDALRRVRGTAPLGAKSAEERGAVLADAIEIRQSRTVGISGQRVLLVDDVMTSGATANACAAVLLAAGAVAVDVLAAARVPDPRLG